MRSNKQPGTHDQSAILLAERVLLSKLVPPQHGRARRPKIGTDLVLENGVPKAFREFAYYTYVGVIILVTNGTKAVRQ